MAERIIMPKQGLQMTEGTIMEWHVSEGGEVAEGKPLFTMETDKLTITIDAMCSGTLLKIVAGPGVAVPITRLIAVVGKPGEDISSILAENSGVDSTPIPAVAGPVAAAAAQADGRVLISPRAKTRAGELGIAWQDIRGSGTDGMIIEKDILAASAPGTSVKATPLAAKTAALSGVNIGSVAGTGARGKITRADVVRSAQNRTAAERTIVPMRGMRKVIADRMKQSQNENAQACHRISVRMDEAFRLREALEKAIGYNDLIAMAVVRALKDFPAMNAELVAEGIWRKDFVNLGVAVAVDDGLIVPVVKDADLLSLQELAAAIKELAGKARNGSLQPDEYTGGSFTLSNLGMFGLEEFVAIINPPEAGILAVGKIEDTPVAISAKDGTKTVEICPVMKLTLSYDHRIVDGAPAAQFLSRLKEYLENPYKLL